MSFSDHVIAPTMPFKFNLSYWFSRDLEAAEEGTADLIGQHRGVGFMRPAVRLLQWDKSSVSVVFSEAGNFSLPRRKDMVARQAFIHKHGSIHANKYECRCESDDFLEVTEDMLDQMVVIHYTVEPTYRQEYERQMHERLAEALGLSKDFMDSDAQYSTVAHAMELGIADPVGDYMRRDPAIRKANQERILYYIGRAVEERKDTPHVNVGTIGHIDHGLNPLRARGMTPYFAHIDPLPYFAIDESPEFRHQGIGSILVNGSPHGFSVADGTIVMDDGVPIGEVVVDYMNNDGISGTRVRGADLKQAGKGKSWKGKKRSKAKAKAQAKSRRHNRK